ncbi:MAG TPA: hypothetical protein VGG33_19835 [Polyangia bacterium]
MRDFRSRRVLALICAAALAAIACSKESGRAPATGSGGAGGTASAGGSGGSTVPTGTGGMQAGGTGGVTQGSGGAGVRDAGASSDLAPATTCAGLRNCLTACQDDAACKQGCMNRATSAAKTSHMPVQMCSAAACDENDVLCRCPLECNGGGECEEVVEVCRGFETDFFCDELCR